MKKKLVLIGGGHSHVLLLKKLFALPSEQRNELSQAMVMVSAEQDSIYSGLLPSVIAGRRPLSAAKIPLKALCDQLGIRFVKATVSALDLPSKQIQLNDNLASSLSATYFSWNVGLNVNPAVFAVPQCGSVRPVSALIDWWQLCLATLSQRSDARVINVVGGGVASIELVLAMHSALLASGYRNRVTLRLLCSAEQLLSELPTAVQTIINQKLHDIGIDVQTALTVESVKSTYVVANNGRQLAHDFCLWVAAKEGPLFLRESGLQLDAGGCIEVNAYLQSLSHPQHFASGDIATIAASRHAKNGVYAVRHAESLYNNLFAQLLPGFGVKRFKPKAFKPQRSFLSLIDLSDGTAIAVKGRWYLHGKSMLWLKNAIDNRFVAQFNDLLLSTVK